MAQLNNWLLDIGLDTLTQARAALAEAPLSAPASANCAELSKDALAALRRANQEDYLSRGLLAHAEALWRCGDAKAADDPLREAETIAARGPMPLFMTQAHLLRARIALSQNNLAAAKAKRDAALELIQRHGYGRAAPEAAVLNAEIACAENAANRDAAIAAAVTAIRGEPYHDERTGITIDGGWWGLFRASNCCFPPVIPALRTCAPPATPTTPSATPISAPPSPRMWKATIPVTIPSQPILALLTFGKRKTAPSPTPISAAN